MKFITGRTATIALGISLCGISGYIIYNMVKKRNEVTKKRKTNTENEIFIKIPKERIGIVIGRNGVKIRELESKSQTKITFDEDDVCRIEGDLDNCKHAEKMIKSLLENEVVIEYEDIWIPAGLVGKVLGRCGEVCMKIMNASGAYVRVAEEKTGDERKVLIKGTKDQINIAKSYINEILEENKNIHQVIKREPRGPSNKGSPKVEQILTSESPFEVYVSAMYDPSKFWIQRVGPKATELDQLVEEMTEYYKSSENKELHKLVSVQVGDLVAATFQYDNKWYRAEVLSLVGEPARQAELYYVDYGDTDTVNCVDLYELRTDFLRLHFQAIECFLAKIEPVGESWAEEAVDKFEEWTHVAQWQKLSAKFNGYLVREKTRAKREGSPVPGVELIDISNDMNIADELVKNGYAVYKRESGRSSRNNSKSNSNVSLNSQ